MSEYYLLSTSETKTNKYTKKTHSNDITFYKIEINDNYSKERWILEKRYTEIDFLHKIFTNLYPNISPITRKTLFKIKNHEALENRKKQIELFLKEYTKRKDIESNESFKNFLGIDKHSPDLRYNSPNIIYENN